MAVLVENCVMYGQMTVPSFIFRRFGSSLGDVVSGVDFT